MTSSPVLRVDGPEQSKPTGGGVDIKRFLIARRKDKIGNMLRCAGHCPKCACWRNSRLRENCFMMREKTKFFRPTHL
jgi:hypothetical protein